MPGERRPLRIPLHDAEARLDGHDLLLSFALPRGSFATSVLREIMKNQPEAGRPDPAA
jgi:tRNA pseudouridine13 synthase